MLIISNIPRAHYKTILILLNFFVLIRLSMSGMELECSRRGVCRFLWFWSSFEEWGGTFGARCLSVSVIWMILEGWGSCHACWAGFFDAWFLTVFEIWSVFEEGWNIAMLSFVQNALLSEIAFFSFGGGWGAGGFVVVACAGLCA